MNLPRLRRALLLVVTIAAACGVTIAVTVGDDGRPRVEVRTHAVPAAPPATAVDGPDKDTKRDDALPLGPAAQEALSEAAAATDRPGDPYSEIADPLREQTPAEQKAPVGQLEGPLAAQEFPGCRTRHVRNFSSRGRPLSDVKIIFWHQTVSFERGWASQDALTARANDPRAAVSWHLLIGRSEGRCTFTVPFDMKAWHAGNGNPVSIGIEVEAFGNEPSYVTGPGRDRLLAATRELGRRFNIPMRRGAIRWTADCRPIVTRSGIMEHWEGGRCAGGHVDVSSTTWQRRPDLPELSDWQTTALIAEAARGAGATITRNDRIRCARLRDWRRAGRPKGGAWERKSVWRKRSLARRGLLCTERGVAPA